MILFKIPNGTIDAGTRAEFLTSPFDLEIGIFTGSGDDWFLWQMMGF